MWWQRVEWSEATGAPLKELHKGHWRILTLVSVVSGFFVLHQGVKMDKVLTISFGRP